MKRGRTSGHHKSSDAKEETLPPALVDHERFVTFVFVSPLFTEKVIEFRLGVRNGQVFADDKPLGLHCSSAQNAWDHFFEVSARGGSHWFNDVPEGRMNVVLGYDPTDKMLLGFIWALFLGFDLPNQEKYMVSPSWKLFYGETRLWKLNTPKTDVANVVAHKMFKLYRTATIAGSPWTKELHLKWCSTKFKQRVFAFLLAWKRKKMHCDLRFTVIRHWAAVDRDCVTDEIVVSGFCWNYGSTCCWRGK
jgi:hypothetical protein